MDRKELIESVKEELGHPVITLFVQDTQLNTMISKAIRKCQSKACPTSYARLTLNGGKIDVSDLGIETVKNIYMDLTEAASTEIFGFGINFPIAASFDAMLEASQIASKRSEIEKMVLYDYILGDDGYLYVDDYSGTVVIEYVKKVIDLEDLDSEWTGWVEGYVTALAKIIEGRIRGKYRGTGGPFETDADTLISDGNSEKMDLEGKLDTAMGYYNIIR